MAKIDSVNTQKIIKFRDLNGTSWTLTITGPMECSFSVGADIVDDEIKAVDVINISGVSEHCLRFRINEDATRRDGFTINNIPVKNGSSEFSSVRLCHDSLMYGTEVHDYDRDNNTYFIK